MRRLPVILALILSGALCAMTVETGSIRGFVYGTEPNCGYDNWVSHLVEGTPVANNHYAPWDIQTAGFGSYRYPSEDDLLQWDELIQAWLALEFAAVDSLIVQYNLPYELVHFQDTDADREYYLLRELLNDDVDYNGSDQAAIIEEGGFDYGWGLYIYNPKASRPMMISAPHPCDDYPSPIIAVEAMLMWDARFLFVSGAGREVLMTGNNNNTSLSDPSRHANHVFNVAYQRACQQLRDLTGKIEFSVQMHSFDWQTHPTLKPVVVSAGSGRDRPSLPIVDESHLKQDLFHRTPWEVIAANTFGTHPAVSIEDYYVVYSNEPIACIASGQPALISTSNELPGSPRNQQMLFTEQPNIYDSYSPFFHIEMAELPIFLPQDNLTWKQFYGWNEAEQRWIITERWTRFIQCYTPWLLAMETVLDDLILMDDNAAPSDPGNFCITQLSQAAFTLGWDRSYDYDFESYEIIINHTFDGQETESIVDRDAINFLARQSKEEVSLSFAGFGSPMRLRLKARDKHGRCSLETEDIILYQPNPQVGSFQNVSISPAAGSIFIGFQAQFQNQSYYQIKRSVNGGSYELYTTFPPNASGYYHYQDTNVHASNIYRYRIGVMMAGDAQFWHHQNLAAQPLSPITIYLRNAQNTLDDLLVIGHNHFAKDTLDALDIEKVPPSGQYAHVWLASRTADPEIHLSRDLRATYDQADRYKTWSLEARVSAPNSNLIISSDIAQTGIAGDLLLWDEAADRWHDLRRADYHWNNGSSGSSNFTLYWGYHPPEIRFYDLQRQLAQAGSALSLSWQVVNAAHLDHLELWMHDRTDSLLINASVSPWEDSYTWQSPQAAFCGYRLLIKAIDKEGHTVRYLSPYVFDLVPEMVQIDIPNGFSSFSIPAEAWSAHISTDFAAGTRAWKTAANQGWIMAYELQPFEAYVLDSPVETTISYPGNTRTLPYSKNLHLGWNLVPNAHFHRYDLSQMRFVIGDQYYSYLEMAERQLVTHRPYTITSRGWEQIEELQPNAALLFQYLGNVPCTLELDPQLLPAEQAPPPKSWELTLSFFSGERGRDSIHIGSARRGADDAISYLDGAKPLRFNNQGLQVYISGPGSEALQSKYKSRYPANVQSCKTWDYVIVKTLNFPLTIEADYSKVPGDYRAQIMISGQTHTLHPGQLIQVDLPVGTFFGTITVTGTGTANYASEYHHQNLRLYPNPFRDAITITWDSIKGGKKPKAAVYNIKGQKVRSLDIGESAGKLIATWDGLDHRHIPTARGVYLIKIESAGRQMTKKVIKY